MVTPHAQINGTESREAQEDALVASLGSHIYGSQRILNGSRAIDIAAEV